MRAGVGTFKENDMNELIEKLKKPELARAYGLMTPEEQECLRTAGSTNTLWFSIGSQWSKSGCADCPSHTYILKPDYKPEPEYDDVEIVRHEERFAIRNANGFSTIPFGYINLNIVVSLHRFVGFFTTFSNYENRMALPDIATRIREGHKVYARFVKEPK